MRADSKAVRVASRAAKAVRTAKFLEARKARLMVGFSVRKHIIPGTLIDVLYIPAQH